MNATFKQNLVWTTCLSAISFLTGFTTLAIISYHFGTSAELDAYWVAFTIVNVLAFPLTPLREALVPEFHAIRQKDKALAERYFSGVMTLILLVALTGVISAYLLSEQLIAAAVSSNQPITAILAGTHLYWLAPSIVLMALSETQSSILVAYNRVLEQTIFRMFGALTTLALLFLLVDTLHDKVIASSLIAGQFATVASQYYALRRVGLQYKPSLPRNLGNRFFAVSGALMFTYAASQIYAVSEKHVLTTFNQGVISSFQYATAITNVIITIIGINLSNLLWPRFLAYASSSNRVQMLNEVTVVVRLIILVIGGICTIIWLNASPLINILFVRGAFDVGAQDLTTDSLRIAVFAAIPISAGLVMGRALISIGEARSVMYTGLAMASAGCLTLFSGWWTGKAQLALSHWLVANICGTLIQAILLSKVCNGSNELFIKSVWWILRFATAMVAAATASYFFLRTYFDGVGIVLIEIFLSTACFGVIYLPLIWILGLMRGLPVIIKLK